MSDNLPPLPAPARRQGQQMSYDGDDTAFFDCYSNSQMQDYARAAIEANTPAVLERDAIAVNLLRHAGLDKHKARECADLVLQMLAAPQPQPVAQPDPRHPEFVAGFKEGHKAGRARGIASVAQPVQAQPSKPTVSIDLGTDSQLTARVVWSDWDQATNVLSICVALDVEFSEPAAFRMRDTGFKKPRYVYFTTKGDAEYHAQLIEQSRYDGFLTELTPLYAHPHAAIAHPKPANQQKE